MPHSLRDSPKTGRRLRYGPAMKEATKHVELPQLAALFADIASPAPRRLWDLNTQPAGSSVAPSRPPTPLVRDSLRAHLLL